MTNEIISIVKRTKYSGVKVQVPGGGVARRDVIVFQNHTEGVFDVYVALTGIYKNYYLKAASTKEQHGDFLSDVVIKAVQVEKSGAIKTSEHLQQLLCEKKNID